MALLRPGSGVFMPRLVLLVAALVSFAAFAAVPHDGFHPLAQLACLLPVQLAALLFVFRRPARLKPPASG